LGYGEVKQWKYKSKSSVMDLDLLQARVDYIMSCPNVFLDVGLYYDPVGALASEQFPQNVDTKGKIIIFIRDNRAVFSHESRKELLLSFMIELARIYSFIRLTATNQDSDIVARFDSESGHPLGYFYQGEYHLQEE